MAFLSHSFIFFRSYLFCNCLYGCMFCIPLFNLVNYVLLLLFMYSYCYVRFVLRILFHCVVFSIVIFMYFYCYVRFVLRILFHCVVFSIVCV